MNLLNSATFVDHTKNPSEENCAWVRNLKNSTAKTSKCCHHNMDPISN